MSRWIDGSIQWLLLDFQGHVSGASAEYLLTEDSEARGPEPVGTRIQIEEADGTLVVDTGAARFLIKRSDPFPLAAVTISDRDHIDSLRSGLDVLDEKGRHWKPRIGQLSIEERGGIRATVLVTAEVDSSQRSVLRCFARLHFFANLATVRIE
jgi:hypothetical protein